MVLEDFLKVIGGEIVRVENGCKGIVLYDGDKNAIRAYRPQLLDREIYLIEHVNGTVKFIVHLQYIKE